MNDLSDFFNSSRQLLRNILHEIDIAQTDYEYYANNKIVYLVLPANIILDEIIGSNELVIYDSFAKAKNHIESYEYIAKNKAIYGYDKNGKETCVILPFRVL